MGNIIQLEIVLQDFESEVNRVLEIDEHMTFEQLFDAIDILFDLSDLQSYLFHIKRSKGLLNDTYIGVDLDGTFFVDEDEILEDENEDLCDYLINEMDYAELTIGDDDLSFLITVKKRISPKKTINYPRCIAGIGYIDQPGITINLKEISEDLSFLPFIDDEMIDELFGDEFENLEHELQKAVQIPTNWNDLFDVADELKQLKPWEYLKDYQVIVVEHPETEIMLFISVLGAGGQEFGLAIYTGESGRKALENIYLDNITEDYYFDIQSLNVSYVNRDELSNEDYNLIKSQGLSYRGKKNWIQFRSYIPGKFPWIPDGFETELLLYAMKETIEVINECKNGWTVPDLPIGDYYFRQKIIVKGQMELNEQIISFNSVEDEGFYPVFIEISEFEVKQLAKKKVNNQEIEFDAFYLPQAIQDEAGERPYYPLMILTIDRHSELVIHEELIPLQKIPPIVQAAFFETLKALPTLPRKVIVSKEIYSYIATLAKNLNIQVVEDKLKAIPTFRSYLRGHEIL